MSLTDLYGDEDKNNKSTDATHATAGCNTLPTASPELARAGSNSINSINFVTVLLQEERIVAVGIGHRKTDSCSYGTTGLNCF